MKRFIAAMAALTLSLGCCAQDMIVKKDGSIIQAKVSEIGTSEVKYKKWSNLDGPLYAIAKSDILAITYQNGEKETFGQVGDATPKVSPKKPILEIDIEDNCKIIEMMNQVLPIEGKKNKPVKSGYFALGLTSNSVVSTKDIRVKFRKIDTAGHRYVGDGCLIAELNADKCKFEIDIENKTEQVIFIDLVNSFCVSPSGDYKRYNSTETASVTMGGSSGSSTGIGTTIGRVGIGTSGSSSSGWGIQKNYEKDQIVAIPPHGKMTLSECKWERIGVTGGFFSQSKFAEISKGEELENSIKFPKNWLQINKEQLYIVNETESIATNFSWVYTVSYYTEENMESLNKFSFTLYPRFIFGGNIPKAINEDMILTGTKWELRK